MKADAKFRHNSLQDRKTIRTLLKAVTAGIGKGELSLKDGNGEIVLEPDGLLNLRIRADRVEGSCRLDLRITWNDDLAEPEAKAPPKVG
ncbi:amphi-Trp domain-containing protein [Qingshengfaniella alkalisoli]|uniref:Amphi-Trp domain-containing protein n=1 Tax=Qingshengfaniella alkalisoli TaxID=2599296 RepID=A0A5B8J159_9RHOB|nr:amphi-Trp domain-containing protein [Qingshengfaniella alkalisoli]QDY70608.1 amphi-Trp domain-containing protein [Qingshengfaniella alkalisoli]